MNKNPVIELETKLTYQEDLLQELNDIVVAQQEQLDKLKVICKSLDARLQEVMQYLPDRNSKNERPPHF